MRHLWIAWMLVACELPEGDATRLAGTLSEGNPVIKDIPAGRIHVVLKRALDETTLTADEMVRRVQSVYLGGIKRCYATGLQMEATARGRVTLKFQVLETGRVANATASGFAKHIDACLVERMGAWVFVIVPKDKTGEPTKAGFEIVLELVPS